MELGSGEIIMILFASLILYGGRLPQVAMAVGRSVRDFKKGLRETTDLVKQHVDLDLDLRLDDVRLDARQIERELRDAESSVSDSTGKIARDLATEDLNAVEPENDGEDLRGEGAATPESAGEPAAEDRPPA